MENLITIVIADDHYVFREDLKSLILKNGRFRIVGEASNGKVAWEQIERLQPDIALLDINMPTVNGLVTAARIEKSPVNLKVIVVTAFKDESLFNKAMDVGVIGYVLKDNYVTDIPLALQTVGRGHPFFSDSIAPFAAKRARKLDLSNFEFSDSLRKTLVTTKLANSWQ
jgi:DNA-binding NarL/FixJ family response regulator